MHDTTATPAAPRLSNEEAASRFAELQKTLVPQWRLIGTSVSHRSPEEQTMVVVPSMSIDMSTPGLSLQAYEERFLFLLLLLRKSRARMVYVTSFPILPSVIDYYLGLLPGVISSHAKKRVTFVSPMDGSLRPLSLKLLERPRLLAQIRALIGRPDHAHLIPYNTTELERELAVRLGIPMYGADPRHFPLGTKSGSRKVFAEAGVPYPAGVEDLASLDDAARALRSLRAANPGLRQALVKLNEGVSGEGNALVDLTDLPAPGDPAEAAALDGRLRAMRFEDAAATLETYTAKLVERGGVVEERLSGEDFRSPSVQMRITPLGDLQLLSTHDQLLGGPSGQSYLGCRFPADRAYAMAMTREARKIGVILARHGVLGRFAVDFVAFRRGGAWHVSAIEINLRKGGTTHPFLTLEFLTDGRYDPETAVFTAPSGRSKHYVATDHLESPLYRALSHDDLFDIAIRHHLHFDHARQTGVVFHMLSGLSEQGRLGLTAVEDSPEAAEALYRRVEATLDAEAAEALQG